jgi:hypothetical protein
VTAATCETAADAGGQALLTASRASYGGALVVAPGAVIYLGTGRRPGRTARRVARLLGARHLIQAGVSAFAPLPGVLAIGAGVDGLHAASMLILATVRRGMRGAALTDALAEVLFATAGASAARVPAARRTGDD